MQHCKSIPIHEWVLVISIQFSSKGIFLENLYFEEKMSRRSLRRLDEEEVSRVNVSEMIFPIINEGGEGRSDKVQKYIKSSSGGNPIKGILS